MVPLGAELLPAGSIWAIQSNKKWIPVGESTFLLYERKNGIA